MLLSYLDSGSDDLTGHLLPAAESRAHRSLSAAAVITASATAADAAVVVVVVVFVVAPPPPPLPPVPPLPPAPPIPLPLTPANPPSLAGPHPDRHRCQLHVLQRRRRWIGRWTKGRWRGDRAMGAAGRESRALPTAPKNLGCHPRASVPDDAAKSIY